MDNLSYEKVMGRFFYFSLCNFLMLSPIGLIFFVIV